MKKTDIKKWMPYIGAILIFLIVTLVYFFPLLEGKRIYQSDIVHFTGMSKEIVDFRKDTGTEPLWTNSMFGGMPAFQISTKYSGNLLAWLDQVLQLGLPHPAGVVFLYFLGFFILLLVLRVNPWLAVAGATSFALSSYFFIILEAGHNSKAHAIAYMAPVMAGIILTFRKKYLWGGIITAIFLSLEIRANHPQITYYLAMTAVILGLFELVYAFRNKSFGPFLRSVVIILVASVLALLTNLSNLWTTYEYSKYTIRGKTELTTEQSNRTSGLDKDYVTQWSYGIGETMTLLIPDIYGGSSSAMISENSKLVKAMKENGIPDGSIREFISQPLPFLYWGDQPFTSGPVYVGAIIFFLFILGLIIVKGPLKWWLLTATLISVMLAWGHNFMGLTDLFLHYLPGYNKFRAVTMILVIAEFTMPLLGILALKVVFDGLLDKKKIFLGLKIALGISGGLTLLFALFPGMFLDFTGLRDSNFAQQFPDWFMQGIRDERERIVRIDAVRSLVFILLAAVAVWAAIYGKLRREYLYAALIILILADMFTVNKRYLNSENFTSKSRMEKPYDASPADQMILQDKDPNFRVLNLTVDPFADAGTSYFHKSLGGYHGAKLRRYQELYDYHISKQNMAVINMLNTRYVIIPGKDKNPVAQYNSQALGNAWFVKEVRLVDNADQEIAALNGFDPSVTAVVDKRFEDQVKGFTSETDTLAFIRMTSYKPNQLEYIYKSGKPQMAVFSEIYYPAGWNAYLDGNPVPYFRANYILRAMVLPAGEHQVTFRFEPRSFFLGEWISKISSILLMVIALILIALEIRKQVKAS